MKVQVATVGLLEHHRHVEWPEGWPVPARDDGVKLPGIGEPLSVRSVTWYPEGSDYDAPEDRVPFVYVVIGRPRR